MIVCFSQSIWDCLPVFLFSFLYLVLLMVLGPRPSAQSHFSPLIFFSPIFFSRPRRESVRPSVCVSVFLRTHAHTHAHTHTHTHTQTVSISLSLYPFLSLSLWVSCRNLTIWEQNSDNFMFFIFYTDNFIFSFFFS